MHVVVCQDFVASRQRQVFSLPRVRKPKHEHVYTTGGFTVTALPCMPRPPSRSFTVEHLRRGLGES